jgi:hypothetical protein
VRADGTRTALSGYGVNVDDVPMALTTMQLCAIDAMFVQHSDADDAEAIFQRTVQSASRFLWVLGAPDQALAALYDAIQSVCGKDGLRAALTERIRWEEDGLNAEGTV